MKYAAVETHNDGSPKLVHLGFDTTEACQEWFKRSGLTHAWITPVAENHESPCVAPGEPATVPVSHLSEFNDPDLTETVRGRGCTCDPETSFHDIPDSPTHIFKHQGTCALVPERWRET